MGSKRASVFAAVIFAFLAVPLVAQAQVWPSRAVTFILPFGAGSATDAAARVIAERLQKQWDKPVVIENRPGGDGLIAIRGFLSANDDHVLLYASSGSFLSHPYTLPEKPSYELMRDLVPLVQVAHTVPVVAAPAKLDVKSLRDWVELARSTQLNAAGAAGVPELSLRAFLKTSAPSAARVPYRDIVPAANDLAESRIQLLFTSFAVVRPLVESGQIRILAIPSGERSPLLPAIASSAEQGFPSALMDTTSGIYGPAKLSAADGSRIAKDVMTALSDPAVKTILNNTGQAPAPGDGKVLAETLTRQQEQVRRLAEIGLN